MALANTRNTNSDALFRRLRLAEERLRDLDVAVSTLRRDVNRIDRKQYREASPLSVGIEIPEQRSPGSPFDKFFEGGV